MPNSMSKASMAMIHALLLLSSCLLVVSASSLPSNALNRWTFIRGGETATTAATPSSRSGGSSVGSVGSGGSSKLIMDDYSSSNAKPKRKRKKRSSSSSSSSSSSAPNTSTSQASPSSPSKRSKTKPSSLSAAASAAASNATKEKTKPSKKYPSSTSLPNGEPKPSSSQEKNTDKLSSSPSPLPMPMQMSPRQSISSPIPTTSSSSSSTSTTTTTSTTHDHDQMPSIFTPEEDIYDKYAACIAATEGLRRIRDSKLMSNTKRGFRSAVNVDADSSVLSWKSLLNIKGSGSGLGSGSGSRSLSTTDQLQQQQQQGSVNANGTTLSPEQQKEAYKRACAEYVLNSTKVIKALGLSVSQFNQLGREVKKNAPLKEKVMEQAYLYRMASTIKMDKIPLIQDPNSKKLLQSHKRRRVQMFVKSITEIEELRSEQMEKLRRALNIDKLPPHMNLCDPNVLPLLNPKVRAVIEAFPLQAEVIVKKYGLNSDEFNSMLEETRGNPIFRWRVQRFKKKSDDDSFNMGGRSMSSSSSSRSGSGDFEF